jgi:LCP family protein required for cell wall assembly
MKKRGDFKNAAFFVVILILVLVFLISGLHILESTVLQNGATQETTGKKTIIRNGIEYFPRQDITVVLVMGIDQTGPVQDSGYYRNEGAADMVLLLIFDEETKDYSILYLNRDTMLKMPVLGIDGRPASTNFGQLALSHTFGNGLETSCENVKKTVSDFLYGLQIDYYLSMNMDAISVMNDAVGGVTVTVTEDFSEVDPSIPMGTVTLRGQQAINYVRTRKNVGDQLNISRIARQKDYIQGFMASFKHSTDQNANFMVSTYEEISEYIVTDCSVNALNAMLSRYKDFSLRQIVTPEGENVLGNEYYEFHVDEEALDALILDLFYRPKK